jgi:hypothetical protein
VTTKADFAEEGCPVLRLRELARETRCPCSGAAIERHRPSCHAHDNNERRCRSGISCPSGPRTLPGLVRTTGWGVECQMYRCSVTANPRRVWADQDMSHSRSHRRATRQREHEIFRSFFPIACHRATGCRNHRGCAVWVARLCEQGASTGSRGFHVARWGTGGH